jgi:hypothetical protein
MTLTFQKLLQPDDGSRAAFLSHPFDLREVEFDQRDHDFRELLRVGFQQRVSQHDQKLGVNSVIRGMLNG